MNKLILIGNVGRDPELRYTPNGQSVTSFSVATNYRYKTASGEQREETEWFNCSAFGKTAEICNQYITKGQQVYIEGRLKSRAYQTQSGESRFGNDITVTEVQFLVKTWSVTTRVMKQVRMSKTLDLLVTRMSSPGNAPVVPMVGNNMLYGVNVFFVLVHGLSGPGIGILRDNRGDRHEGTRGRERPEGGV